MFIGEPIVHPYLYEKTLEPELHFGSADVTGRNVRHSTKSGSPTFAVLQTYIRNLAILQSRSSADHSNGSLSGITLSLYGSGADPEAYSDNVMPDSDPFE